jgi:catechol 2,3-dioxygenase-like lactoylglutathione lyase family enzyme
MTILGMDHYAIRTDKLEPTKAFYEQALGFAEGPRPPFKFPGYWLYCGAVPVVHLIGRDAAGVGDTGAVDHIAFRGEDVAAMRERLTRQGIAFEERTVPKLNLTQLFMHDPNGIKIELNYPPEG